MDFTNIFQLKDPKPKNKGQTNFYECCDLMKKVYLAVHTYIETRRRRRRSERKMELSSSSRVAQTIDEGDRNACSLLQIQFPFILDLSKEKESSSEK